MLEKQETLMTQRDPPNAIKASTLLFGAITVIRNTGSELSSDHQFLYTGLICGTEFHKVHSISKI